MRPFRTLHIVPDEKFIDFFHRMCLEVGGGEHTFFVVANERSQLRYIKSTPIKGTVDLSPAKREIMRLEMAKQDCIVIHFLNAVSAATVMEAPPGPMVVWSGWGSDYADLLPGGRPALLGPRTRQLYREHCAGILRQRPIDGVRELVRPHWMRFARPMQWGGVFRRVDYFSAPIEADFIALKASLGSCFRAEFLQLNYGSVGSSCSAIPMAEDARDILVGNSASVTNNHLEVFQRLSRSDFRDRRIVVPLSYGDPWYRDRICDAGRSMFGPNFVPIVDFLPLQEYLAVQSQCAFGVFNHVRQEGLGNVIAMVSAGSKVVMHPDSPVRKMLALRGCVLGSTGANDGPIALSSLTPHQRASNRAIIESVWGDQAVLENFKRFANLVRSNMRAKA